LNPTAGGAQNMLGYAALRQGDTAGAIAAFEQYAKILPQEPNAHDSLGEALLGAGRFQEAEAAFQKSLEVSPQFWAAHEGMAYTKLYRGDWAGGTAALVKAKETATRWADKIQVDDELVAVAAAQRNTAQALKMIDAIEKTVGPQPSDVAFEPLRRGMVLLDAGRAKEALAPIATALTACRQRQAPGGIEPQPATRSAAGARDGRGPDERCCGGAEDVGHARCGRRGACG
jgi:tetratricopeptide (TPR) repeat protein